MNIPGISENGSSETGDCSNVSDSGRVCNAPRSSVLFDGIPTLTGLDGDMWARQLLTLNTSTSSASITFNFTTVTDRNGDATTYTGVEIIEVVMFNCHSRGIGANNVQVFDDNGSSIIDNINNVSQSCQYLVRACTTTISTTSQTLTLTFDATNIDRLYLADIAFYSSPSRQCSPVGSITSSVITDITIRMLCYQVTYF